VQQSASSIIHNNTGEPIEAFGKYGAGAEAGSPSKGFL